MTKKSEQGPNDDTEPRAEHGDPQRGDAERGDAAPAGERSERERLEDQLRRAMADLSNIRKRHAKELEEARRRALEGLAAELLPVLDNFELALAAHQRHEEAGAGAAAGAAETKALIEGLHMVRSLLSGTLERHGLSEIAAAGTPFDPNVHEAVSIAADAEVEPGHVAHVVQTGYRLGERVIRPAKVVVAADGGSGGQPGAAPADPDRES